MFMVKTNSNNLAASDRVDRRLKRIYTTICIITIILEVVLNTTRFNRFLGLLLSIVPLVVIYLTWQSTTGQFISITPNPIYKGQYIVTRKFIAPVLIGYRLILEVVLAVEHDVSWILLGIVVLFEIIVVAMSFILDEMYDLHDDMLTLSWARKLQNPERYEFKDVSKKAVNAELGLDLRESSKRNRS